MSSQVVLLAEAVKQTLLAGSFVTTISPEMVFDTEEDLKNLGTLGLAVLPGTIETTRIARNRRQRKMSISVVLRKRLTTDDHDTEIKELTELCDEIEDLFEGNANATFPSASCISTERTEVADQEKLVNLGQFSTQINLTYLDFGDSDYVPGNGGENLDGVDSYLFTAENKDLTQLYPGQPVGTHTSGTGIVRANASAVGQKAAIGIVAQGIQVSVSGLVQTEGIIEVADWTRATGSQYLTPGSDYYLSTTLGKITRTAPSGAGQILQLVGHALTQTKLDIRLEDPINL